LTVWIELRWLRFILVLSQNGDLRSQLNSFRGIPPLEEIAIKYLKLMVLICSVTNINVNCSLVRDVKKLNTHSFYIRKCCKKFTTSGRDWWNDRC